MTQRTRSILQEALKLARDNRAALAEELLKSLGHEETVRAAAREAHRHWRAYRRGDIGGKPAQEVIDKLRKRKRP